MSRFPLLSRIFQSCLLSKYTFLPARLLFMLTFSSSVLQGLLFVRSGCFVNTSRVNPSVLSVESRRLKIAGANINAVGIMLGVATECFLVDECLSGSANAPYPVHKVTIVPFAQEMRRDTSLWGQLFGFHLVTGSVSNLGISFSTRRQRK